MFSSRVIEAPRPGSARTSEARATANAPPTGRLVFIDNVRWAMIVLVLSMHAAVTYSPLGSWYYRERPPVGPLETLFFATYQGLLQGFFMALLFFVAGFFTPTSYDAKGPGGFMIGRLRRLGLPTLFYVAALGPMTVAFANGWRVQGLPGELGSYFASGRFLSATGPMWFCVALLVFCAGYVLVRAASARVTLRLEADPVTGAAGVALTVAAIASSTFVVRLWQPMGSSVFNMQLCYFPSYVVMFGLGVAASRERWLEWIGERFAILTAGVCVGVALAMWLPLLLLGGALQGRQSDYAGGVHWQSAALSLWEALVCVGMSFGVLALFRRGLTRQRAFSKFMSDNAFAVYVIHPPILVALALALAPLAAPPIAKFVLLWVMGLVVCFGLAAPIARRVPGLGAIL
jgi:glucan biosynthesis protein C